MDALPALLGLLLSALGLAIVWGLASSALQSGMDSVPELRDWKP